MTLLRGIHYREKGLFYGYALKKLIPLWTHTLFFGPILVHVIHLWDR